METKHPDTCLFALAGSSGGREVFFNFLARKEAEKWRQFNAGATADLPDGIQICMITNYKIY
ncbi:MAG: hypothetical protein IPN20_15030 [Haliscomenobacter sp.]|nr:hypothetical protein [Haliscomenobacter sp.]